MTMKKGPSKKASKKTEPTLSADQVKDITDYIKTRKGEGIEPKVIRKEVFKKFGIDTTQWELNWGTDAKKVKGDTKNHRVAEGQQLSTTNNTTRRHEPISFKYEFSEAEVNERANILAQLEIDRDQLESEKKNIANDYKTKIEEKETQIGKIAREINSGFEMRNETCEVIRDYNTGQKRSLFKGKVVKEEKMSPSDYTLQFPEDEEEPAAY